MGRCRVYGHWLTAGEREWALSLIPKKETEMVAESEAVQGVVVNANERGFQLQGEEGWRNWSKWATEPRTLPSPGHRIQCLLDKDGYVRSVALVGGSGRMAVAAAKQHVAQAATNGTPAADIVAAVDRVTYGPATNRSAEREFRLKCLELAFCVLGSEQSEEEHVENRLRIANRIAAWAEGREA